MERYNLPTGGIEVIISGSQPQKCETVETEDTVDTETVAPAEVQVIKHVQVPQIRKKRPVRYLITRSLLLVGAFALVGNIPVHSKIGIPAESDFFSVDDALEGQSILTQKGNDAIIELNLPTAITTFSGHESKTLPSASTGQWKLHKITRGENIDSVLEPLDVLTTTEELFENESVKKELARLKTDKKILIQINNRRVEQLIYATGKRKAYIVSLQDGEYLGKWDNGLFEEQHNRIAFTIKNPFHYEANKAGLPRSITRQLVKIFKKDVNFRRIKIGDQISVIFEDYYYQSERIFTDKVLAAEFQHRDDIFQRVRFVADNDTALYLKPNDDLALKEVAFNRYPLKGGRLTSGFGMRRHPVLRKRRMHSGVDFAAPRGTPIYATGDGKVRFVGRKGGYGKSIELRHANGITTRYGHMSKYKKGLKAGSTVKRGDVIGYVGSTGRSTGNHVHYEYHVNGVPKNPMRVKLPMKGVLTSKEMKDFKRLSKNMSYQLIKLRDTAAIERNVSQQFGG